MRKILFCLIFCMSVAVVTAYAQETDSGAQVDEGKANAVSLSFGAIVPDALKEPGFGFQLGASVDDIMGSGIDLNIDTMKFDVYPKSLGDLDDLTLGKGFDISGSPFSVECGLKCLGTITDETSFDCGFYNALAFSLQNKKIASVEVDVNYLEENSWKFGLGMIAGVGYEYAFGDFDTLSAWIDCDINLYRTFSLTEIEGSIGCTHAINKTLAVTFLLEPTIVLGDEVDFTLEPGVTADVSF